MYCENDDSVGCKLFRLANELWPLNRSLTGAGVRDTLQSLKRVAKNLVVHEVPSGKQVFDWQIPKEWLVRDAWILAPSGRKICNFKENNLHLVGYSTPIICKLTLKELMPHLHSLPSQPNAIPYVTSYYEKNWGFCIAYDELKTLPDGEYEIFIDTELFDGVLNYGEILIPGESCKEVFLSTYICHPSMANNEISGPVIAVFLSQWLAELRNRTYSYRIIFIPETIGSIAYLSTNLNKLKENVIAGFNLTCLGDDRTYSYLPSRAGNSISDDIAKHVLKYLEPNYKSYTWSNRGSDERQYCAPHIDLPVASIMRSKYGEYPEYHTSLDNLERVVSPSGLEGGYIALKLAIEGLERNCIPVIKTFGEPQLGKRGLYPSLSIKNSSTSELERMMNLITWSDGRHTLLEIANIINSPIWELYQILDRLVSENLIELNPINHD